MRVLVVEDRGVTQASFEAFLRLNGCWTDHAGNGDAALVRMSISVPDAVVTDHLMPGKTGVELIQAMRGQPRYASIPVALMSAIPECDIPIVLQMVDGLPLVKYFSKPVDPHAVLDWLKEVTGKLASESG